MLHKTEKESQIMTVTDGEEFKACSPPEYIRRANARESRARQATNFSHFIVFLRGQLGDQTLSDIPDMVLDQIVTDYLDRDEARAGK
jgi:hypothetical protein